MENFAPNNAQAVIQYSPVFTGKVNMVFLNTCARSAFACRSIVGPCSRCSKARSSRHLLYRTVISKESTLLLSGHGSRRTKIYGASYSSLHLVQLVVKRFEGKQLEDGVGNGQAALEALRGKYNSHTKGARRACHEKLVTASMDPVQDPDDFFFILDECRQQLEDMRESVHD